MTIAELVEQIHQRAHQGQCEDIHPVVHAAQMRGFYLKAVAR
jgi:hypothetical protein